MHSKRRPPQVTQKHFDYSCLEEIESIGLAEHLALERKRNDEKQREKQREKMMNARTDESSMPVVPFLMGRTMINVIERTDNSTGSSKSSGEHFSILSYNMLCQMYAKRRNFPGIDPSFLDWKFRRHLLWAEFMCYGADVICLQEMDRYEEHWRKQFTKMRYSSVYKRRTRSKSDGCAVFWRDSVFSLVESDSVEFNDLAVFSNMNRVDEQRATDNVAIMVVLRHKATNRLLIVVNVHLFWDPSFPEIKLEQCFYLLQKLHEYRYSIQNKLMIDGEEIPFVLCGDFNSLPDSEVYELLSKGSSSIERTEIKMKGSLRHISAFPGMAKKLDETSDYCCPFTSNCVKVDESPYRERIHFEHDLRMRSAYSLADDTGKEPPFTNYTENFVGCLDYIWVSDQLDTDSVLQLINEQDALQYGSLPSKTYPSDHVSLFIKVTIKE